LYPFLAGVVKEWTGVRWIRLLVVFPVLDRVGCKRAVLGFERCRVCITGELFHDVLWHGKINITFGIVPLEFDTAVEIANAILNNVVGLGAKTVEEVL